MRRIVLVFFGLLFFISIPFVRAQNNQKNDDTQITQDLNKIRKDIIDLKRDFYSFKIATEKKQENLESKGASGSQVTFYYLLFAFSLVLVVVLFLLWLISKNFRNLGSGSFLQSLEKLQKRLAQLENKKQMSDLDILEHQGQQLKLIQDEEVLERMKKDYDNLLKQLLESYAQLVKEHPDNAQYFYAKAQTQAYLERKVSALQDLKQALQLDPSLKEHALKNPFFKSIRNFNEFKKMTGT